MKNLRRSIAICFLISISACVTTSTSSFEDNMKEAIEPLDCDLKRKLARCVYYYDFSEESCRSLFVTEDSKKECKDNKY